MKILLVEDHPEQVALIDRWLRLEGLDVTVACDGVTGSSLAQEGDFDLVLSDMNLPCASGADVARSSKDAFPDRPVLLMTAHRHEGYAADAVRSDADDLLHKPLRRGALVERVKKAARRTPHRSHNSRTVLAVGAHPDDIEIGVGGTLFRHRAKGDRVVVLVLTQGAKGGDKARRRGEMEHAARLLGAELVVGDLTDTAVGDGPETIQLISDVVSRVKPDVVYTHTLDDMHQDHRAAHRATLVAARSVPAVFCYQSPSSTPRFHPSRFVDIKGSLQQKLALIAAHGSQTAKCAYLDESLIRATARYWGRFAGYRDVEPLEVVRTAELA